MNLSRLFAFEVYPQKKKEAAKQPSGGPVKIAAPIEDSLNQVLTSSKLENSTPIAFHVVNPKEDSRQNEMRDFVIDFCFEAKQTAKRTANKIALRLSQSMDNRSKPLLLLISSFEGKNDTRRFVLWAFPKDEVFKFYMDDKEAKVEYVPDVFSVSSELRKAAIFEGVRSDDSFWEGQMLDFQSGTTDYWIKKFLACRLSASSKIGTLRLAKSISDFYKSTEDETVREQLLNAVTEIRTSPTKTISPLRFAKKYISKEARDHFLSTVPSEDRNLTFDFDRESFEKKLGFKLFKMKDNVFISAPLETIGDSVNIDESTLNYMGEIADEQLRSRSG